MRKLLKVWDFDADMPAQLTYSSTANITVDARRSLLTLKQSYAPGTGRSAYPTAADIFVILPLFEATALQTLEMVQVIGDTPKNPRLAEADQEVTSTPMRLHDGADHYWYSGAAWVVAGAGDWNTAEELSNNIGSWDLDTPFALVVGLLTSDGAFTPTVSQVKLLYSVELVSFLNDWVYSTLIALMVSDIRPQSDLITEATGGTSLALADLELIGAWDITAIDGVYNEDTDPKHRSNLYSSYNTATKVITLGSSPTAGARLLVRYRYAPQVAVQTSQDYTEVASSPSLVFETIEELDQGDAATGDHIVDVYSLPPAAVILPAPRRVNLNFSLLASAPSGVDLDRLTEAVGAFLESNRLITSEATGITRSLRPQEPFSRRSEPSLSDLHTASVSFTIENVYIWHGDATEATGVGALNVGFQVGATTDTVIIEE